MSCTTSVQFHNISDYILAKSNWMKLKHSTLYQTYLTNILSIYLLYLTLIVPIFHFKADLQLSCACIIFMLFSEYQTDSIFQCKSCKHFSMFFQVFSLIVYILSKYIELFFVVIILSVMTVNYFLRSNRLHSYSLQN